MCNINAGNGGAYVSKLPSKVEIRGSPITGYENLANDTKGLFHYRFLLPDGDSGGDVTQKWPYIAPSYLRQVGKIVSRGKIRHGTEWKSCPTLLILILIHYLP